MSTFTDDFDRPDGGVGNNWTTGGTTGISNGMATFATSGNIKHTDITGTGRQECIATVVYAVNGDLNAGPILKSTLANSSGYTIGNTGTLASPSWRILRAATNGSTTALATGGGPAISVGSHTIRYLYADGLLSLWVDGYLIIRALDNTWDAQSKGGWIAYTGGALLDSIAFYGDESTSFSVTPSTVGNYGAGTQMLFSGVGTSWGIGTPGSPTFTVDHGSLSSQEVTAAGSAGAIYTPGNFLGTATFLDPSTGATDTVVVTSDPAVIPPTGTDPWMEDDGAMVHATVANWTPNPILNAGTLISASGAPELNVDIVTAIGEIWAGMYHFGLISRPEGAIDRLDQIWKGLNSTLIFDGATYVPDNPGGVKEDTDTIRTSLAALRTTGDMTLADVVVDLQGTPSVTLAMLAEAIDALSAPDLQPILDAIAAVRGLGTPDLTTILGVIDDLTAGSTVDLGMLSTALSGVDTTTSATATAVSAIATAIDNGFAAVLDAIAAIQPGGGGPGAPTWPGLSGVSLGASTPLASSLDLAGPMDGIVVAVTGVDTGVTWYTYHDVKAYRAVGALAFYTDRGDIEAFQTLGFEQAIYVPKTMQHAGGVKLFCSHGLSGTVRPWTVS